MSAPLPLSLFNYPLPPERIAQAPVRPRDASRLLQLDRVTGQTTHHVFRELPARLAPTDLLVVNRTRVIPARLHVRKPTGGRVELLFVRPLDGSVVTATRWAALGKPGSALKAGRALVAADETRLVVEGREADLVIVRRDEPFWPSLEAHGQTPLPPYITRPDGASATDADDYQTVFARELGAVAAPTASLHFTDAVLSRLTARGVERREVVLHVGPGTFLPVRPDCADDVRRHQMHAEIYEVPADTARAVRAARREGRRVIAVGTTSVRALETWWGTGEARGESELFIYPGYAFGAVDGLITNFHLPRSTLLMLVSALAGREAILAAYREAIDLEYRFFSYGDAMLIA